jgi:hypothetical protein
MQMFYVCGELEAAHWAHCTQMVCAGGEEKAAHWALVAVISVVVMPTEEELSPGQNCCIHQLLNRFMSDVHDEMKIKIKINRGPTGATRPVA